MHVKRSSLETFAFFHTNRPKKAFSQTFLGWKMTTFFSILFKTPQEPAGVLKI